MVAENEGVEKFLDLMESRPGGTKLDQMINRLVRIARRRGKALELVTGSTWGIWREQHLDALSYDGTEEVT